VVFFNTNKMGAGGQMNVTSDGQNVLKRVPTEKPPFEISDLKKAIPMEATMAIKPILGDYYKYDDTPILKAFWRETKNCIYVEPDGAEKSGVYWFHK
ncbi:hypothetical protein Tco_1239197, partial [Tanacetum coccineum]